MFGSEVGKARSMQRLTTHKACKMHCNCLFLCGRLGRSGSFRPSALILRNSVRGLMPNSFAAAARLPS